MGSDFTEKLEQAKTLHREGATAKAESLLNDILKTDPEHFDALNFLGVMSFQSGAFARAEDYFNRALKTNPGAASALSNLGGVLNLMNRFDEALACFDKAIAANPAHAQSFCNRAGVLHKMGRLDESLESLDAAISLKPDFAEALSNRAFLQREMDRAEQGGPSAAQPSPYGSTSEIQRRRDAVSAGATDFERWTDERQLEQAWESRARFAADYVPAGAAVLDLGCGKMAFEKFLPPACRYIPCDLARRDERTIVCDFNAGAYPDEQAAQADLVSFLGVMEYIFDPLAFLSHVRQWRRPVLMSYCTMEGIRDREQRRALGWVNDLSYNELIDLFGRAGFAVQRADRVDGVQWLFKLQPGEIVIPATKRVAVLSYNNVGNFGDRLGYHLINAVLPAQAEVSYLNLRPWTETTETYDLLVVGIGNSLFGPLLDHNLLALLDRSRASIGIFGTQYHEALPRPMLNGVLNRLTHWYARYEDDILRYGRAFNNVSHLGDWLIAACPMAKSTLPQRLDIGKEIWDDLPLDRTIQNIQKYKAVFSTRLHPLLCALTSAEQVGYREQRELNGLTSGKFRSMLLDIFGRTFPEEELWSVDRAQVVAYKRDVDSRIFDMRAHIHRLLGSTLP